MRPSNILRWCLALVLLAPACAAAQAAGLPLSQAEFLLRSDTTPPDDAAPWVEVRLPDNWSATRREAQGIGWYRMDFQYDEHAQDGLAILVRRLSMNGEMFVNGTRVLSGGRMEEPITRNWNTPFFVEVPRPLLKNGGNRLHVRIYAYRNSNGGLGSVYIGAPDTLHARHAFLYALHVKGAIISFAVTLVAAFMGIVCWWRMGRESMYGLFGLAMVAWAARYANYFVQEAPIPPLGYALIVNSAQGWFFIFFTPFLLRLAQLRWRKLELALYAMGFVGTAGIFAAFQGWVPLAYVIVLWLAIWIPGSATLLMVSTRYAWHKRTTPAVCATLAAWLYVPITVRELLITANLAPFDTSYVAHYVAVPMVVLMSWLLIDRIVASARAASKAELARARAIFDERRRITQDMHDGLGLQLNAALRQAEHGHLDGVAFATALRACLDELRLIVDASASDTGEFLTLLGNLRFRLQPKLAAIGLQMHWHMEAFPDNLVLPQTASLQLLRIVQEAINNTIKHAGASAIHFEMVRDHARGPIALIVRDDGQGFDPRHPRPGQGLDGMRRRATAAGASLRIDSGPVGTAVRIELPTSFPFPNPRSTPHAYAAPVQQHPAIDRK